MPGKGRPRITPEVYEGRLQAYCARYAVSPTSERLPPFPAGQRETPQHREWISLYKAHSRLARRARGVCERCSEPAGESSVFCDAHRPDAAGGAARAASPEDRRRLLKAQAGRCPVCAEKVGVSASVRHEASSPRGPVLLHLSCARLLALAQTAGPKALDRLRAYLWPGPVKAARG